MACASHASASRALPSHPRKPENMKPSKVRPGFRLAAGIISVLALAIGLPVSIVVAMTSDPSVWWVVVPSLITGVGFATIALRGRLFPLGRARQGVPSTLSLLHRVTSAQAKQLDGLMTEFSLAYLAVFDSAGRTLYQTGSPATPACQRAVSALLGSEAEAARTFASWAAQRLPGGGGAGADGWTFYLPQQNTMVAAFFCGYGPAELTRKSGALGARVVEALAPDRAARGVSSPARKQP